MSCKCNSDHYGAQNTLNRIRGVPEIDNLSTTRVCRDRPSNPVRCVRRPHFFRARLATFTFTRRRAPSFPRRIYIYIYVFLARAASSAAPFARRQRVTSTCRATARCGAGKMTEAGGSAFHGTSTAKRSRDHFRSRRAWISFGGYSARAIPAPGNRAQNGCSARARLHRREFLCIKGRARAADGGAARKGEGGGGEGWPGRTVGACKPNYRY